MSGSITELHFPSRSHLISASEDGTIAIFHARDWVVLRVLKGHKGRINSIGIHPSGKVALSVGVDKTLRMWDLMRGKGSASTKLGKGVCSGAYVVLHRVYGDFPEGEKVRWSTNGNLFVVQSGSNLEFFDTVGSSSACFTRLIRVCPESCFAAYGCSSFPCARCQVCATCGDQGRDASRWRRGQKTICLFCSFGNLIDTVCYR
jgi:hypothetical protein